MCFAGARQRSGGGPGQAEGAAPEGRGPAQSRGAAAAPEAPHPRPGCLARQVMTFPGTGSGDRNDEACGCESFV